MTERHLDLTASASITAAVSSAIPEDALDGATASTQYRIGDLLEHVEGLALGLEATARKQAVPPEGLRDGDAALNEIIVHGWELAVSNDQDYAPVEADVLAVLEFLQGFARTEEADGVFGPVVEVPARAPALDRLLGLTGRDPGWRSGVRPSRG